MACPRCGRKSIKGFNGFCSKVHYLLSENKQSKLVRLFCSVCDRPIFRTPSKIPKGGKPVCDRCSKNQGENHGNFKGARYLDPKGYVHILIEGRYVLEHRYVWQKANRACIVPWQPAHIHHINFNKSFNTPRNLLILLDEEHMRVHRLLRLGRQKEAYKIMHKRALEQYFYPDEVDKYDKSSNSKDLSA